MSYGNSYNIFEDLNVLKRMLDSFERYLRSNDVYGSVGGGLFTVGNNPSLTVGSVLMRLRRLDLLRDELDQKRQQTLDKLIDKNAAIRADRPDRYLSKMEREAHSRLDAMQRYFEECARDLTSCANNYNPEVLRRTITQEILLAMEADDIQSADLDEKIKRTDSRLRRLIQENEFVWDDQLQTVYPADTFWWMYGAPPRP